MKINKNMRISLKKIASEVAKTLSLKHQKDMAYRMIMQDDFCVIDGLCVEPRPDGEFSVHTFLQALYIPFPALVYNMGDRIGYWNRNDWPGAIHKIQTYYEQQPHYDNIATIIDKVNNRQQVFRYGSIIIVYEFLAYSYIAISRYDNAKDYLERIIAFENDEHYDWFIERVTRAKILYDLIGSNNWEEIRNLLLMWQKETMTALKLPEQ